MARSSEGAVRFVEGPAAVAGLPSSGASVGRFAVASRALRPGEVAMRTPPLAAVLHEQCRGRRCDWCFVATASDASAKPPSRCARCKAVFYCGRECQEADWKAGHRVECTARAGLEGALVASGLPGHDALKDALLAGRCVRAAEHHTDGAVAPASGRLTDLETLEDRMGPIEREQLERIAAVLASHAPKLLACPSAEGAARAFGALCRFRNNNFAVVDDLIIAIGAGCYPKGAALNHSCAPNCMLGYELAPGQAPRQVVRVMEPVAKGAELTHSYVELALPTWERRAQLQDGYGFDCACVACASGSRAAIDAALVADVAARGAVPRGPGAPCPLPLAPASEERERDLARADALHREASLEEDADKELQLLQEVCRLRESWLHHRHMEVMAAHASAHTAAIAAGAWPAAERHCQHLVEQYVDVYPEWHPISGLQMYTLAELKENRGDIADARRWYARAKDVLSLTHGENHGFVDDLRTRLQELS
mmetsp:Transcript_29551/g.81202  ORF Transcript_29551/g.81202 Transcript_29551/m.81202 type:complete len:483 (-) Transcript_29551:19-1467(-)